MSNPNSFSEEIGMIDSKRFFSSRFLTNSNKADLSATKSILFINKIFFAGEFFIKFKAS